MERGCKISGVQRIRIHDIRHSHVSMLIDIGFSAVDIAGRMGHESIDITLHYAHMFPTAQRDIIVNFRMSPEERREEQRILISGKKKQDYMIQSSLEQKLFIVGNPKMIKNIRKRMDVIEAELKRVVSVDALDMGKLAGVKALVELFEAVVK